MVVPGLGRARLLLPAGLLDQLNEVQRRALLLHELIHIKRRDHLLRLLEMIAGVAFWWLPLIGWISRHLRACEERCCDASVVSHLATQDREYAKLLLNVLDFVHSSPVDIAPQATAMSAAYDLELRIRAILGARPRSENPGLVAILALGLAFAILPLELRYTPGTSATAAAPVSVRLGEEGVTGPPADGCANERMKTFCCPS
jgi:beta-lactamase regulating signal transducer with metallopeptidase domain